MTKRPGDAACGDTVPRMLLERYWERMLHRIKGSAESIEHTSDSERPRVRLCDAASPMILQRMVESGIVNEDQRPSAFAALTCSRPCGVMRPAFVSRATCSRLT
jgi:hypothetical protein